MNTKKTSVSPIIYNNGNRNITTLFDLNIFASEKERRLDMNADITKVKNLILNDEEAMNYFILIAMFYSTQEEGKEERHREDEWLECKTLDDRFFYMNMKTGEKLPCGVQPIIRGTKND